MVTTLCVKSYTKNEEMPLQPSPSDFTHLQAEVGINRGALFLYFIDFSGICTLLKVRQLFTFTPHLKDSDLFNSLII